jgi:hypothetical protein
MPFLFFAAIALIGAAVHIHRDSRPRSYLGDAYGHLHQAAIHDNHTPDNTGLVLWADFIAPLVAIGLFVASRRAARTRPSA